jgi:malate dehydrogenase (oxaloacetate-decarboxylating)
MGATLKAEVMSSHYDNQALQIHYQLHGKITVTGKAECNAETLPLFYTPGVGAVSSYLQHHPEQAGAYSVKGNSVAVVSDGSAVLGLGNIGPYGALPVMEGKAMIFHAMAGIDAFPICLDTQDSDRIVETVCAIAPSFGGINLEDISAPRCYYIERRIQDRIDIPVMHDDQHATAIVALAGLINACAVTGRSIRDLRIVILGAGASASGTARLLAAFGLSNIVMVDSRGVIHRDRANLDANKKELAELTNPDRREGSLEDALAEADCVIGLASGGLLSKTHIRSMARNPIVFALSNPDPEIDPLEAFAAGAAIVATGRSDYHNQINNALVFPGLFRGALDAKVPKITTEIKLRAAQALACLVADPTDEMILPSVFDPRVVHAVAASVTNAKPALV